MITNSEDEQKVSINRGIENRSSSHQYIETRNDAAGEKTNDITSDDEVGPPLPPRPPPRPRFSLSTETGEYALF